MVNPKCVSFRESSIEKSPSPKRFMEPDDMRDIDLRRLSQLSGFSDASLRRQLLPTKPLSYKRRILKCFLAISILTLVIGSVVVVLHKRAKWDNFLNNISFYSPGDSIIDTNLKDLLLYYMDKLEKCKTFPSIENCCSFIETTPEILIRDCSVDRIFQIIEQNALTNENTKSKLIEHELVKTNPIIDVEWDLNNLFEHIEDHFQADLDNLEIDKWFPNTFNSVPSNKNSNNENLENKVLTDKHKISYNSKDSSQSVYKLNRNKRQVLYDYQPAYYPQYDSHTSFSQNENHFSSNSPTHFDLNEALYPSFIESRKQPDIQEFPQNPNQFYNEDQNEMDFHRIANNFQSRISEYKNHLIEPDLNIYYNNDKHQESSDSFDQSLIHDASKRIGLPIEDNYPKQLERNQEAFELQKQTVETNSQHKLGDQQQTELSQKEMTNGKIQRLTENSKNQTSPEQVNTNASNIEPSFDQQNPSARLSNENKLQQFVQSNQELQPIQQNKQCFTTYTPQLGSAVPIIQQQIPYAIGNNERTPHFVPLNVAKGQPNGYVINPQYTYVYPPAQPIISGYMAPPHNLNSLTNLQAIPTGQYYVCNPAPVLPAPSQINGMVGVEVRNSPTNMVGILQAPTPKRKTTMESDTCAEDQEICADETKCIKRSHICDGDVQCRDASDESECSCRHRIGELRICDGYFDCPDGEDEIQCFGCRNGYFNCDDWSRIRKATCIPIEERCDGISQCETGNDELDCYALLDDIQSSEEPFKISSNIGYLHRNFKGKWYPICEKVDNWALQACMLDSGPSALPPIAHSISLDTEYRGLYANADPKQHVHLVKDCLSHDAIRVECPQPTCGTRKITRNPYRTDEIDTSAEEIAARYRIRRNVTSHNIPDDILGDGRVVGGKACQPGSWPWVASIYKNGIFHCGGALISELWLVTAGHCVEKYWRYYYEIELGMLRRFSYSPMQQTRYASHIIPHPEYNRKSLKNDIALIRMNEPVKYNRYVRPICLPTEFTAGSNYKFGPTVGTVCTAVGWGATIEHGSDPDHLREVEVPVLSYCKHKEDAAGNEICAGLIEGGKDACQGDSGGPFLCRNPNVPNQWYLAGVISHGEGCARPNEPGVYTRVPLFRDWIYETAKDDVLPQKTPLHQCPGYICEKNNKCIPKKRHCDRIVDCLYGDDEYNCKSRRNNFVSLFQSALEHMQHPIFKLRSHDNNTTDIEPTPASSNNITETILNQRLFKIVGEQQQSNETITSFASPDLIISDSNGHINRSVSTPVNALNTINETARITTVIPNSMDSATDNGRVTVEKYNRKITNNVVKRNQTTHFLCKKMMEVIPLNKVCNKVADCQDGTDEESCTCMDYLRITFPEAECDGVTDCWDLSDEDSCGSCRENEFFCRLNKSCIPLTSRCDNKIDCSYNEDEWNCFTLTNDYKPPILDIDGRPEMTTQGVLTIFNGINWQPLCGNFSEYKAKLAADVCSTLGFMDYEKYIDIEVPDQPLQITFNNTDSIKTSDKCNSIYIKCSNVSVDYHDQGYEDNYNVESELWQTPWNVAIYSNGHYKCAGVLIRIEWVLTSIKCFSGILKLDVNYITIVLGAGRGHLNVKGPYENIIAVIESKQIQHTDAILLRLQEAVTINRYIRPVHYEEKDALLKSKENCIAIGMDSRNRTGTVMLRSILNCLPGHKCFKRFDQTPAYCNTSDVVGFNIWTGVIVCESENGFYPASLFHELSGECGFTRTAAYINLINIKHSIWESIEKQPVIVNPPRCEGFRCQLGNCIDTEKMCNGLPECRDGEDEEICSKQDSYCHLTNNCICLPSQMKCLNGKCVDRNTFCNRVNDCGDLSDEPDRCSCVNYLLLTAPNKICDGIRNCMDRSDEDPLLCNCEPNKKQFTCESSGKCIPEEMMCDMHQDCPKSEDEAHCTKMNLSVTNSTHGEILFNTAGVWHRGCIQSNLTANELTDICKKMDIQTANASYWNSSVLPSYGQKAHYDQFQMFWINRKQSNVRLALRSGDIPFVTIKDDMSCNRLLIKCS